MLKQLDTLIGFVVVMAVVSLLITVITQVVSTLLGLRGKHLADALEAMIHKIDPTINDRIQGSAKELAKWILIHPVLSDSVLSMRANAWDGIPLVAWVRERMRVACAVRPDELFQVLQDVAGVLPDKALAKQEIAQEDADNASIALQEPAIRIEIQKNAQKNADLKDEEAKKARDRAVGAAASAEKITDLVAREEASKDAARQLFAAREAAKIATQAREVAEKAAGAVKDDSKAKQFALEAAMRAAAVRLLAALYLPATASPTASSPDPATHAVVAGGNVNAG